MRLFIPSIYSDLTLFDGYLMNTEASILLEGSKAYYDNIPRWKNPYEGEIGEVWIKGWDFSQEEHKLFTESKNLDNQIQEQKKLNAELETKIKLLKEELARVEKSLSFNKEIIQKIKLSMLSYQRDMDSLGVFNFRKKVKEWVKAILDILGS